MKHPDHKLSFADIKIKIRIYMSNLIFFPDKQFLCHVKNFDNSICSQYQISKSVILIVSLMVITSFLLFLHQFPVGIYLLKVNIRNTRTRCEICSKLTIKMPERRHWRHYGVFINFEHISHLVLVFLLLTLNM